MKVKVEVVIVDKFEIEKDLKDNKLKFFELSNILFLVYLFLESLFWFGLLSFRDYCDGFYVVFFRREVKVLGCYLIN